MAADPPAQDVRLRRATDRARAFILSHVSRLGSGGLPEWRDGAKLRAFNEAGLRAVADAIGYDDQVVLIAESVVGDGTIDQVGVIHAKSDRSALTGESQAYVSILVVVESAGGHGIGHRLMRAVEEWAVGLGHRMITLEVFADNRPARRFYDRLGYQEETLRLAKRLPVSADAHRDREQQTDP